MAAVGVGLLLTLVLVATPVDGLESDVHFRLYTHKSLNSGFCTDITLEGSLLQIARFKHWLNEIMSIPYGRATLKAITSSGHKLTISHSRVARISAGRTQAPMSENLINGKGESVNILFDATISERGSHFVYNGKRELIDYTAVANLFHELAHAKHKMSGSWRYFDSEGQAIEEENKFRRERALLNGSRVTERVWKTGVPVESVARVSNYETHTYIIRSNPVQTYDVDTSSHRIELLKAPRR